jgi:hypothetical protein
VSGAESAVDYAIQDFRRDGPPTGAGRTANLNRLDRLQGDQGARRLSLCDVIFENAGRWGRIGRARRRRLDLYGKDSDAGVINAWSDRKLRRGYTLRPIDRMYSKY